MLILNYQIVFEFEISDKHFTLFITKYFLKIYIKNIKFFFLKLEKSFYEKIYILDFYY